MASERNALAGLAERLASNEVRLVEGDEFPIHLSKNAVLDFRKARRIIAELAKVKVEEIRENPSMVSGAFINLMTECRTIAEEGATDGTKR